MPPSAEDLAWLPAYFSISPNVGICQYSQVYPPTFAVRKKEIQHLVLSSTK